MKTFMLLFGVVAVLLLLCFAFIGIKMFVQKNGEFKKQCASVDPKTGKRFGCTCEGEDEENCNNQPPTREYLDSIRKKHNLDQKQEEFNH